MPRPPKTAHYDADDATIIACFDDSLELVEQQRATKAEITAHNVLMHQSGVDPGALSICRRLALMKEGKRGVAVSLLHRYLQILASRLHDPTIPATRNGEARREVAPFERSAA